MRAGDIIITTATMVTDDGGNESAHRDPEFRRPRHWDAGRPDRDIVPIGTTVLVITDPKKTPAGRHEQRVLINGRIYASRCEELDDSRYVRILGHDG